MATLTQFILKYRTRSGREIVTIEVDPSQIQAYFRTEADARREHRDMRCTRSLSRDPDAPIREVHREPASMTSPPNSGGCIRLPDGTWWCPDKDEALK
jgi:hypothetical protein